MASSKSIESPKTEAPYRPQSNAGEWSLPLRSDPKWLTAGLIGTTIASVAAFAGIFRLYDPRVNVALSLLPSLSVATFASSALSFWGRRKGGTLELYGRNRTLRVKSSADDVQWLDARDGATFGALVLEDEKSSARVFVFSQGDEPRVVIDRSGKALSPAWKQRVIRMDFSALPVSAETAGAIELAVGADPDAMLALVEPALSDSLWIRQPLPSGDLLMADDRELRVGDQSIPFDGTASARRISVGTATGEVSGLSITHDLSSFLFACIDPTVQGAEAQTDAPTAYLHPALFAALATRLRAQDSRAQK